VKILKMSKTIKISKKILLILIPLFFFFPIFAKAGLLSDILEFFSEHPFGIIGPRSFSPLNKAAGYIISLLVRLPLFFFALTGFIFALLSVGVGYITTTLFVNKLINLGLDEDIFNGFDEAWGTVSGFALGLVEIFLLIIGLATIFKVAEYEARRTLIPLIIAALLVSFSLTIGKKLIKWGNELTNHVASQLGSSLGVESEKTYIPHAIEDTYETLSNDLINHFGNIWKIFTEDGDLEKFFTERIFIIGLISTSYWVFGSIGTYVTGVLMGFGIVFLIRLIYLSCLLVVSPIAFLTAGIRTKEIRQIFGGFLNWDGWWPKFLEWVFIGIVLMVWLVVGLLMLDTIGKTVEGTPITVGCPKMMKPGDQNSEFGKACDLTANFMAQSVFSFLPIFACALVLHIGMKTSPEIMRKSAEGAIKLAGVAVNAVATAVTAGVAAGVAAASGAAAAGVAKKVVIGTGLKAGLKAGTGAFAGKFTKGISEIKEIPESFRAGAEVAEAIRRRVPWARRALIYEREEAEREVEKAFKEKGPKEVQSLVTTPGLSDVLKMTAIKKSLEEGFYKEEWLENKGIRGLTFRVYEEAAKKGDKRTMGMIERRLVKSLAEDSELQEAFKKIATKHKMYDEAKEGPYIKRIIKGVRTADDVKQLQKGWWEAPGAMEAAQKFWTGHQWGLAAREFGKELVDALHPIVDEIRALRTLTPEQLEQKYRTRDKVEAYKKIIYDMPGLARYSETAAAQEAGIPSFYAIAPDEVKFTVDERGRRVRRYRNMREILAEMPSPPPSKTSTDEIKEEREN
jgi:hypothetical protein